MDNHIRVSFSVPIDVDRLAAAKKALEESRPGTVQYSVAYDALVSLHKAFLLRLEGECNAYMNIARKEAKETFGLSR